MTSKQSSVQRAGSFLHVDEAQRTSQLASTRPSNDQPYLTALTSDVHPSHIVPSRFAHPPSPVHIAPQTTKPDVAYLLKFRMQQRGSYASLYSSASDYESGDLHHSISTSPVPLHDDDGRISMLLEECFSAARAGEEMEKMKKQPDISAVASRNTSFDSRSNRKSGRFLAIVDKASLTPEDILRADAVASSTTVKPVSRRQHDSSEQVRRSGWDSDSDDEGSSHPNERRSIWLRANDRLSSLRPKSVATTVPPPPRPGRHEQQTYHVPKLARSPTVSSSETKVSLRGAEVQPTKPDRDIPHGHARQPSDSTTFVADQPYEEQKFKPPLPPPSMNRLDSRVQSDVTMGERHPVPRSVTSADEVLACLAQGMAPPGMPEDPALVTWSGTDDAENPRNLPKLNKWLITLVITLATLAANMGISTPVPALGLLSQQYDIDAGHLRAMMATAFLLAFAIAPLLYAPLSEVCGRKLMLTLGSLVYLLTEYMLTLAPTWRGYVVLRVLSGCGASACMSLGGLVVADIWAPQDRQLPMNIFSLAASLGPAVGPMLTGLVTQLTMEWKDVHYVHGGVIGLSTVLLIIIVPETYVPRILARRAARLRKEHGGGYMQTVFERKSESLGLKLRKSCIRPFVLLMVEPLVLLLSLQVGALYAVSMWLAVTFPAVYGTVYHESPGPASCHYAVISTGTLIGGLVGGKCCDYVYRRLTLHHRGYGQPEYKLAVLLVFAWFPPLGLLLYAVGSGCKWHWLLSDLGVGIFAIGVAIMFIAIQSYIIDTYTTLAVSALSASIIVRSLLGFGIPMFAEKLYNALGLEKGGIVLATAVAGVALPLPIVLFFGGQGLRRMSKRAWYR